MIDEGSLSPLVKQIDFALEHFLLFMAHITLLNHHIFCVSMLIVQCYQHPPMPRHKSDINIALRRCYTHIICNMLDILNIIKLLRYCVLVYEV